MISKAVDEVVNVLQSFLPENIYALDFTPEHYKILLEKLNVSNDENTFNLKKGVIIEGLVKYFNISCQNITAELSFNECTITKHFMSNMGSETFDRVIHDNTIFLLEVATRKSEFQTLPNLVVLPQEIRDIVFQAYMDKKLTMEKARSLIRLQVNPAFDLGERDVVFFLRSRIWIRYHIQPKKPSDGRDNRFAGESSDELETMYNRYFPEDIWSEIESVLNEVLEEKLNFSLIDNITFTRSFIPVFRGMIEILLVDTLKPSDHNKIEGFTGYVLRQFFDKILLYCAKNLLEFVENRDRNAEIFIKNFTDNTVIDSNGSKTQKYAIVDDKQQKWNYVSILSILMQYKQVKQKIVIQNRNIETAREKVIVCEVGIRSDNNNQLDQEQKIEKIQKLVAESDLAYFTNKKDGHTSLLASQAKRHEELLSTKKIEENELDIIKNRITNKVIELKRRRQRVAHEIKAHALLMEQITPVLDTYDSIAHGVAVALTKR